MKGIFKFLAIVIPVLTIIVALDLKRLQFEYYVWNLSSEDPQLRGQSAQKIIELDKYAVPLLIHKLDHEYIFETYYEVYCLEEITKANLSYDLKHFNIYTEAIPFWKKWWSENRQNYEYAFTDLSGSVSCNKT